MTKQLIIVTTNHGKFEEIKRYLQQLDPTIIVTQEALDLPEYQDMDIRNVALGKAQHAWELLKKPLMIDDGGIYIEKYNRFPGVFTKYVYEGIGLDGIWKLAQDDPRAYMLNCLVFIDGPNSYEFFEGITKGVLTAPVPEIVHKQLPYRSIFIPEGHDKTIDQLWLNSKDQSYSHRYKAVQKFIDWYEKRNK